MPSSSASLRAYRARARGRVQRIGYRRFILDLAQDLGLAGYVGNERDGSVTIFDETHLRSCKEAARGFLVLSEKVKGLWKGASTAIEEVREMRKHRRGY